MKVLPMYNPLGKKVGSSGQALLVVLLSMAAVLTLILSVSSRSVVEIKTSTYEEDSARAFSAAEAGVEQALLRGSYSNDPDLDDTGTFNVSYEADVTTPNVGDDGYNHVKAVAAGETVTFWFVDHDGNDLFCGNCLKSDTIEKLCWGSGLYDAGNPPPAIEVSVYFDEAAPSAINGDFSNVKVSRKAFEANPHPGRGNNIMPFAQETDGSINGKTYNYCRNGESLTAMGGFSIGCAASDPLGCLLLMKVRRRTILGSSALAAAIKNIRFFVSYLSSVCLSASAKSCLS